MKIKKMLIFLITTFYFCLNIVTGVFAATDNNSIDPNDINSNSTNTKIITMPNGVTISEDELMKSISYKPTTNVTPKDIAEGILNEIKKTQNHNNLLQSPLLGSTLTGAAWPYAANNSQYVNCYGYVSNTNVFENPGYFSGINMSSTDSVYQIARYVVADMNKLGRPARQIASSTDGIFPTEYRVALRIGTHYISGYGNLFDYHFMLQTSDGGWCHKPDSSNSQYLGMITPSGYDWALKKSDGTVLYDNFYDSYCVYIAITK